MLLPKLDSFACILPLLKSVHNLIKVAQSKDVFLCDFVTSVKICESELYWMYVDCEWYFQDESFTYFNDVGGFTRDALLIVWCIDHSMFQEEYLIFHFKS